MTTAERLRQLRYASGQVCDELEIALHRGGRQRNSPLLSPQRRGKGSPAAEDGDYCQEQTGMGLVEYSTQVMAEAPEPPTGPAM